MSAVDIIERAGDLLVSSETIADGAGVEHRAVLQLIGNNVADFEEFGTLAFEMRPLPGGGNPVRLALLNEQQATLLMTFQRNTSKVREFKKALVRAFFDMARRLNAPAVPQSLPEALRAYAAEVEQREALEAKVAADAPKVHFAEAVTASDDSILIRQLANILKQNGVEIGQNRLFEKLRNEGYLCKSGSSYNLPTQRAMSMGLFEVVERADHSPTSTPHLRLTTKVTGKGQQYFVDRFVSREAFLPLSVAS